MSPRRPRRGPRARPTAAVVSLHDAVVVHRVELVGPVEPGRAQFLLEGIADEIPLLTEVGPRPFQSVEADVDLAIDYGDPHLGATGPPASQSLKLSTDPAMLPSVASPRSSPSRGTTYSGRTWSATSTSGGAALARTARSHATSARQPLEAAGVADVTTADREAIEQYLAERDTPATAAAAGTSALAPGRPGCQTAAKGD